MVTFDRWTVVGEKNEGQGFGNRPRQDVVKFRSMADVGKSFPQSTFARNQGMFRPKKKHGKISFY
jgi:hypothetical protein